MPVQALLAIFRARGERGSEWLHREVSGLEVGAGRAGEGLCTVEMPRAGGYSQVCLRGGMGLAQAQPR